MNEKVEILVLDWLLGIRSCSFLLLLSFLASLPFYYSRFFFRSSPHSFKCNL